MLLLPFIAIVILMLLGVPIAFALAGSGILGLWLITGDLNTVMKIVGMIPYGIVSQYALMTIPMFIAMALLSSSSGLASDLFTAASKWLSHIRGGLAVGTVFAVMIFGAMSGASTAAASVMSKVALPNMRRLGYSDVLAAGVVGVGATTDILIPPSVALVIYGIATETSIGKLLIAGVIPGILVCILLIFCIFVWVTIRPSDAPNVQRVPWAERWQSLWRIWACLLLVAIVIVLLYTGVATPTEVGALGAFIAGLIGVIFGRLNWAGTVEAFKGTLRIATMIFLIIIGAYIFGIFITMSRVPDAVINTIIEMNLNRWIVIIGIVVAYFVVSMFMDEIPLLLITLQLTFPLIIKLGFDPIWYGIISMMMVSMGLIFPPVGIIAFIVSAAGNVDLVKVFKGTSILMIATILATVLIMVFPQIALWLPSKMR